MNKIHEPKDCIQIKNKKCQLCGGYITDRIYKAKKDYKYKKKLYCYACKVDINYYKYGHRQHPPKDKALAEIKETRIKELYFLANKEDKIEKEVL